MLELLLLMLLYHLYVQTFSNDEVKLWVGGPLKSIHAIVLQLESSCLQDPNLDNSQQNSRIFSLSILKLLLRFLIKVFFSSHESWQQ